LSDEHGIHHEAADDHEGEFCGLMLFEVGVDSFSCIKHFIFYALDIICNKKGSTEGSKG
jgi:hypothetical protein